MIYIVLLVVLGFFGISYMNAKDRINYANKRQSLRKTDSNKRQALKEIDAMKRSGILPPDCYPSWMPKQKRTKEFFGMVLIEALTQGVPKSFILKVISNPDDRAMLMLLAGTMEGLGSSFEEQALGVSDMVNDGWKNSRNH